MRNKLSPEKRRELATLAGINDRYLYQCLTGIRDMEPETAVRVEKVTKGQLTRQMLLPNRWRRVWPELKANSKPSFSES